MTSIEPRRLKPAGLGAFLTRSFGWPGARLRV